MPVGASRLQALLGSGDRADNNDLARPDLHPMRTFTQGVCGGCGSPYHLGHRAQLHGRNEFSTETIAGVVEIGGCGTAQARAQ